ncbi:YcgL domain-containing protein [Vibrio sp. HN007]|uniref:YcgL domain-containing protein n=1 Tax=Vibrio iocasae TaxID=3098914 RepID=UPI0035D427C6
MFCSIYKTNKKDGAYLYIPKRDDFSKVPDSLLEMFGKPTFVMMIKLEERKLAQVDIEKVKESISEQGFFLQLPPPPENVLDQFKEQKKKENS